jgi:hypothetical protein
MTNMAVNANPARRRPAVKAPSPTIDPPPTPEPSDDGRVTATMTFHGRELRVVMPRPEQLVIWQRTLSRLGNTELDPTSGTELGRLIDRVIRIVETVLPERADHEWLEDQLLDGGMTLADAANIVTAALAALRVGDGTSDTEPPARPKARARR